MNSLSSLSELLMTIGTSPSRRSLKRLCRVLEEQEIYLSADRDQLLERGLDTSLVDWYVAVMTYARELRAGEKRDQIKSPSDAARLVADMAYLSHEEMRVILLDTKNRVVEVIDRYRGTVNSSVLRAAEIFRPAIARNCPGVIICHNHPSGDPLPSPEDIQVTEQLVAAGGILDIDLVDHLIIGNPRHVSLKEHMGW